MPSLIADAAAEAGRDVELVALREANRRLETRLARARAKVEDLVDAVHHAAKDAYLLHGTKHPVPKPPVDRRRGTPEVALWVLSDWQGAKVTPSYDTQVMQDRVRLYCRKAAKITAIQRADHPVKECVIALGGDMCEGLFNFPSQAHEIDTTLFGQFVVVSELLIETVRYALATYDRVTVVAEWGNHGRIGSKRDGVPRPDNFDRMIYEHARQMLRGEKRLIWEDSPEDIQRIEIGNYRAILLHSDEIGRNGFASPATIVSYVVRQKSGAYPWRFRDAYIGHYHTHATWALPDGEGSVFQTGSTESENRYAGVMLAAQAVPSQRLHFVDPDRGRVTAEYKVWLDA